MGVSENINFIQTPPRLQVGDEGYKANSFSRGSNFD